MAGESFYERKRSRNVERSQQSYIKKCGKKKAALWLCQSDGICSLVPQPYDLLASVACSLVVLVVATPAKSLAQVRADEIWIADVFTHLHKNQQKQRPWL